MARLRYNNCFGALGAQQLAGDLTITLAAQLTRDDGQAIPTIAAPDTLDIALESFTANYEVERITAYTSGATTATVTRGIAGTAKTHASGAGFGANPSTDDWVDFAAGLVHMRQAFH